MKLITTLLLAPCLCSAALYFAITTPDSELVVLNRNLDTLWRSHGGDTILFAESCDHARDADFLGGLAPGAFAKLTGSGTDSFGNYAVVEAARLSGSTAADANLTIRSTSHAIKGNILFGSSCYNDSTNRLGIRTTAPANLIDATSNTTGDGAILGNMFVGVWPNSAAYACLANNAVANKTSGYAFIQNADGATWFNAAANQVLTFNIAAYGEYLRISNQFAKFGSGTYAVVIDSAAPRTGYELFVKGDAAISGALMLGAAVWDSITYAADTSAMYIWTRGKKATITLAAP